MPGTPEFSLNPWIISTKRCLAALFPRGFEGLRIADLGCLEGGYAVEFARMGFSEVLGIEVRKSNFANCVFVKKRVNLPGLQFVQDNVWNLEKYGPFDVIYCGGILYHLDAPKRFLEIVGQVARKAVLINTHFATVVPIEAHSLSDMTYHEGLPGRWFAEAAPQTESASWASWENARSFWIQREHLIQVIRDVGFAMVFEQFDHLGTDIAAAMNSGYYKLQNRGLFVGVKV
jgi:SAM-dependent methyltransferase